MTEPVAITGIGIVCSLGNEPALVFEAICAGRSGAQRIDAFAALGLEHVVAAPVSREAVLAGLAERDLSWPSAMAVVAARAALRDAGLEPQVGGALFAVGCSMGSPGAVERHDGAWSRVDLTDPLCLARYSQGSVVAAAARALGATGEVACLTTTCAAGNYALGAGLDALRNGAFRAVVGGVEELSTLPYVAFHQLRALADVCRPFDAARSGLLFGEGAAFLVLEPLAAARARGARVYAELAAVGFSNDAFHLVAPDAVGAGAARAVRCALAEAGHQRVEYVNAHGTGTPLNDAAEARAIVETLGAQVPVSSTKGGTGHCMGAASAVEAVLTALALHRGELPPTVGLDRRAPEVQADVIAGGPRRAAVEVALSNGFGFGGNNAVAVLGKPGAARSASRRPVWLRGGAALWGGGLGRAALARHAQQGGAPRYAGELRDVLGNKGLRHVERGALLWAAALEHELPSWLDVPPERAGVAVGSAYPAYSGVIALMREFQAGGAKNVNPALVPFATANCAAAWYAIRHGITGFSGSLGTGRCSGLDAVRLAAAQIRAGRIDAAVAGGVEAFTEELWITLGGASLVEAAVAVSLSAEDGVARLLGSGAAFGTAALERACASALASAQLERADLALVAEEALLPTRRLRVLGPTLGDGLGATGPALLLLALEAAQAAGSVLVAVADEAGFASAIVLAG